MLHHVSFTADRPREVAEVLAELIGGKVGRFGPWAGGYIAWAADSSGTAIEIYPTGTELSPHDAGGQANFAHNYFAQRLTGTHAALSVDRTEDEVLAVAAKAGWQAQRLDRGGFDVIEVWVENRVMLEILTPAMATRYLAVVDAPRVSASGTDFHSLTLSARVATDVHTAWNAWATARGLTRWWNVPHARIDLRVNGAYELLFLAPGGEGPRGTDAEGPRGTDAGGPRGTEGCRILSYVPDRMLSFTWSNPAHLPGGRNQTWVVLTFTEFPNGTEVEFANGTEVEFANGTEVEIVHNGFEVSAEGDAVREYFRQAWRRVLKRMVSHWEPESGLTALPDLGGSHTLSRSQR